MESPEGSGYQYLVEHGILAVRDNGWKVRRAQSENSAIGLQLFDDDQGLAVFDGLAVLDQYLRHGAGAW